MAIRAPDGANNIRVIFQQYCEYPVHRDVTMLASMCKLKVGRLSREVGFFSMMLMFTFFDVSDDHEDYMCDVDNHDVDV